MRSLTNSLIAAATLLAAAGSAPAQSLKVEIPFSFRAGEVTMAPGTYRVAVGGASFASTVVRLYNESDLKTKMFMAIPRDAAKEWQAARIPKVSFACIDGRCSLATVWIGDGSAAMELRSRKHDAHDSARIQTVTLDLKAE